MQVYQVRGQRPERWVRQTDFSNDEAVGRGGDIMELGYRGPGIGKALRALLDAVVEERVPNEREALLELLRHDVMPGP